MSSKAPENTIGQPPKRRTPTRSSTLRSKPVSTMPATGGGTHTIFTTIANLQMSKTRQENIRDALQAQVDRANEEIARLEQETQQLLTRAGVVDKPRPQNTTREVFGALRGDAEEPANAATASEDGFHYQY